MKNINKLGIFMLVFLSFFSCDKGFEELNTDPNNAVIVPSGLLLADVLRLAGNLSYSTQIGGDMGSCWGQHWSKVQYNDEARYTPRATSIDNLWDVYYEDVASDSKSIVDLAIDEGNSTMQAVGYVMQAYAFSILTDCYGDIPMSEALNAEEGIIQPVFDSQEDVYTQIIEMLDQADVLFLESNGLITESSDLLYGGDAAKWQKFGRSLKFRSLMRISGAKDVSSQLQAVATGGGMFSSTDDNAAMAYLSVDPNANPMFETINFGNRGEFKVSSVLVDMLTLNDDPRLGVYADVNVDGVYRGKPAGIANVPNTDYDYNNVSAIGAAYLEAEVPAIYMSYSELNFLMAEAVTKGYITGNAQTLFTAGINASLEDNGLSAGDLPIPTLTADNALEQIATQNWLGLFCQGLETWTEQRRTGYPVLTPAIDGAISEIPSRFTYPSGQQSLSTESYQAAIARQGEDKLTTKMWWNK